MKFRLISGNLIILLEEALKCERLVKLLKYPNSKALQSPTVVNTGSMMFRNIFPTPFTGQVPQEQSTELRIFIPNGQIKNRVVLNSTIVFQIVIHNDLWTIMGEDGKEKLSRPYEIMSEITDIFEDKSIGKLGIIKFTSYNYQQTNKDYGLFNLEAKMVTI